MLLLVLTIHGTYCQEKNETEGKVVFVHKKGSCRTYNDEKGTCVDIKDCEELKNIQSKGDADSVDIILKSKCGFRGFELKVCCRDNVVETKIESGKTECGKTNFSADRISGGGRDASLGSWKWMAALGFNTTAYTVEKPEFRCGGALISDRYILTAAHCFADRKFTLTTVRLGELDLDDRVTDGAHPVDYNVDSVITHPSFIFPSTNDIALIRVQGRIRYNAHISPICLPTTQMIPDMHENKKPFIAGWGDNSYRAKLGPKKSRLQEANVRVRNKDECSKNYTGMATIDHRVLCAGIGKEDACQGDSGGPLMMPNGSIFYLIGVVSSGVECSNPKHPGVYTNVSAFIPWITDNVK